MPRLLPRLLSSTLLLVPLLSACGPLREETEAPPAATDVPAEEEPIPVEPDGGPGGGPQLVEPAPGSTVNPRPVPWDTAEVVGDDERTLRLTFSKGVEPCDVLDDVEVEANEETVTVTLLVGAAADAGEVACIEVLQQFQTEVTLDEPVGTRALLDGADA